MEKRRGPRMQFPYRLEYIAFLLPFGTGSLKPSQDPVSLNIPGAFADSNVRGD